MFTTTGVSAVQRDGKKTTKSRVITATAVFFNGTACAALRNPSHAPVEFVWIMLKKHVSSSVIFVVV
jgi:hypothetical protein